MTKMNLARARNVVDQLFTLPHGSVYGALSRTNDGREALTGVLFFFDMQDRNGKRMLLQLYKGLGDLGGALWEQEARTLMRLSSLDHPGLPRVLDGGHKEDHDIAFVLTEEARYTLDTDGAMDYMAQHPRDSLRQFVLMADGLRQLHSWRMLHRNLWPGALEVVKEPSDAAEGAQETVALRLARFEMSTLVSNLLRSIRLRPDAEQSLGDVRQLYRQQGARALICFPPERLAFLYPNGQNDMLEDGRSDVYGLGMIAYQWFIRPLSDAQLASVFPDGGERFDRAALQRLWSQIRAELREQRRRLGELSRLLTEMLESERIKRPTGFEVCNRLAGIYQQLIAALDRGDQGVLGENAPKQGTYLVSTAPEHFEDTLCSWGMLEGNPSTDIGWEELKAFIEDDLRSGTLHYSPDGFSSYQRGSSGNLELQKARYVLIGKRVAYFASLYDDQQGGFRLTRRAVPQALHIRYSLNLGWREARHLTHGLLRHPIPEVEVVRMNSTALDKDNLQADRRPSWEPLLRSVEFEPSVAPWQLHFERAIELLLDIHSTELTLKYYSFNRIDKNSGGRIRVRYDKERDDERLDERTLNGLYAKIVLGGRLGFADFFDAQEDGELWFFADADGRPSPDPVLRGRAFFRCSIDPQTIIIEREDGAPEIPERGWLLPGSEWGSIEQLRREQLAKEDLFKNRSLMQQLYRPRALVRQKGSVPLPSWFDPKSPGAAVVQEMLNSWPFYALHGPPGTGKTSVTAAAVRAALLDDPSLRILVSAQSHYSLDNMADRILTELADENLDVQAMRVASQITEQNVSEEMQKYLPRVQAEKRVEQIIRRCEERLASAQDPEPLREIIGEWKACAESSTLEIMDRLRRGTNLIFATCSGSSLRSLEWQGDQGLFDWVIVEEAAKAWATELAIPLVRGVRWTLIGDFHQMFAFRRMELGALLDACAQSNDPELRQQTSNKEEILYTYDLFRSLFERDRGKETKQEDPVFQQKLLQRPLGEITVQYRMQDPIGQLVSNITYDGKLTTAPRANQGDHGLSAPAELRGEKLLWLDTAKLSDSYEEPYWHNPGEVRIIKRLVSQLRPSPLEAKKPHERLAILTPFRSQKDHLLDELGPDYQRLVHTVDSFQGKEADIVIVSLVRTNDRAKTNSRLGFLTVYQRANVLLSRARKLLILVGSFKHFDTVGKDPEHVWNRICAQWSKLGKRIDAPAASTENQGSSHA